MIVKKNPKEFLSLVVIYLIIISLGIFIISKLNFDILLTESCNNEIPQNKWNNCIGEGTLEDGMFFRGKWYKGKAYGGSYGISYKIFPIGDQEMYRTLDYQGEYRNSLKQGEGKLFERLYIGDTEEPYKWFVKEGLWNRGKLYKECNVNDIGWDKLNDDKNKRKCEEVSEAIRNEKDLKLLNSKKQFFCLFKKPYDIFGFELKDKNNFVYFNVMNSIEGEGEFTTTWDEIILTFFMDRRGNERVNINREDLSATYWHIGRNKEENLESDVIYCELVDKQNLKQFIREFNNSN